MPPMRTIMTLLICLLSAALIISCGRRTKKTVEITDKKGVLNTESKKGEKTKLLKVELEGVHTADLQQTWIKWYLRCDVSVYPGSVLAGESVVGILMPVDELGPCTLRADGVPPAAWTERFKTTDGLLYTADIENLSEDYINVLAVKHFSGPGADPTAVPEADDVSISTIDGGKCQEFDTETFKCIE